MFVYVCHLDITWFLLRSSEFCEKHYKLFVISLKGLSMCCSPRRQWGLSAHERLPRWWCPRRLLALHAVEVCSLLTIYFPVSYIVSFHYYYIWTPWITCSEPWIMVLYYGAMAWDYGVGYGFWCLVIPNIRNYFYFQPHSQCQQCKNYHRSNNWTKNSNEGGNPWNSTSVDMRKHTVLFATWQNHF